MEKEADGEKCDDGQSDHMGVRNAGVDAAAFASKNRTPSIPGMAVVHPRYFGLDILGQSSHNCFYWRVKMRKNNIRIAALALVVLVFLSGPICSQAQVEKAPYPAMAPLDQYLISDENAEIALARSAAPASVSDAAEVMVLRRDGYATAAKGSNGFVCIVERAWANTSDASEFWNPKMRAPTCYNAAAASTFLPIFLMKTKLVLAGKSKAEIGAATASALGNKELPPLAPAAMCYMMSKQQYLNDGARNWHPHVMFLVAGDAAKSWGANLPGSPIIATDNAEAHVTIFMVLAGEWSDGSPGPPMEH
jgi:hypothetical protein